MKIHCKYDALVDPATIADYPRNPNKHDSLQIEDLAKLYAYHGVRHPIIVDRERLVIAAGHARKQAALKAGIKEFPVVYQDFDSEAALYAFVVADNAMAVRSELDFTKINIDISDFGPDFDVNLLGVQGFTVDVSEKLSNTKKYKDQADKLALYLEKDVNTLRLNYLAAQYAVLIEKLDEVCAAKGLDNYSDAVYELVVGAASASN